MPTTTQTALLVGTGAALGATAYFLYNRNRRNARTTDKVADCSFTHVPPFDGDPLAVPPTVYTDQVKSSPYRAQMGLSALDMGTYIELGSHYPELMAERRKAIAEQPEEVTFMLPKAKEASMEYLHYVAEFLVQRYPTVFERIGKRGLRNKATGDEWEDLDAVEEPMKVVGALIPDDVAIMTKDPTDLHPDDDKLYKYAASVNCYSFPGKMMKEKIGMVMQGLHEPVPGFNQRILKPVNSWFEVLQRLV